MKAKFGLLFLFTHLYLSSPKSKIRIHDCIVKAKYSENIQFYAWLDCRYFSQILRMEMEKWLTRIKMGLLRYRILLPIFWSWQINGKYLHECSMTLKEKSFFSISIPHTIWNIICVLLQLKLVQLRLVVKSGDEFHILIKVVVCCMSEYHVG